MKIYSLSKDDALNPIKERSFKNEAEIQKICDKNLKELFNLNFIKSQFAIKNFRIDTLAFDEITKSFVIIEYKNNENFSVIDQGYAYLSLILNNKSDCILAYNESKNKIIKRDEIDWAQTGVIFIAPSFTPYQIQSINFRDLPIILCEIKFYDNNIIILKQIEPMGDETIKKFSKKDKTILNVNKEIKLYSEEEHLSRVPKNIKELYENIKNSVLKFGDDITIKPVKFYIGFMRKTNFLDIKFQKSKIKLFLNLKKGILVDPKKLARDVSDIGHHGNGDYEINVKDNSNLDYILSLIKQSYDKNTLL
jgi:predicted transport protein